MDSYIVKSVLNDILTEVEEQCKHVLPCKPSRTNGWHLFYRDVVGKLSANLDQEKVGARLRRKLSKEDMKE